jgi:branched-subunit amino acid transport protein
MSLEDGWRSTGWQMKNLNLDFKSRVAICVALVVAHLIFNTWLFWPNERFDPSIVAHLVTGFLAFFQMFLYNKIINGVWFLWSVKDD